MNFSYSLISYICDINIFFFTKAMLAHGVIGHRLDRAPIPADSLYKFAKGHVIRQTALDQPLRIEIVNLNHVQKEV